MFSHTAFASGGGEGSAIEWLQKCQYIDEGMRTEESWRKPLGTCVRQFQRYTEV